MRPPPPSCTPLTLAHVSISFSHNTNVELIYTAFLFHCFSNIHCYLITRSFSTCISHFTVTHSPHSLRSLPLSIFIDLSRLLIDKDIYESSLLHSAGQPRFSAAHFKCFLNFGLVISSSSPHFTYRLTLSPTLSSAFGVQPDGKHSRRGYIFFFLNLFFLQNLS